MVNNSQRENSFFQMHEYKRRKVGELQSGFICIKCVKKIALTLRGTEKNQAGLKRQEFRVCNISVPITQRAFLFNTIGKILADSDSNDKSDIPCMKSGVSKENFLRFLFKR